MGLWEHVSDGAHKEDNVSSINMETYNLLRLLRNGVIVPAFFLLPHKTIQLVLPWLLHSVSEHLFVLYCCEKVRKVEQPVFLSD